MSVWFDYNSKKFFNIQQNVLPHLMIRRTGFPCADCCWAGGRPGARPEGGTPCRVEERPPPAASVLQGNTDNTVI